MVEEMAVVFGPQSSFFNLYLIFSKNLMRKSLK